MARDAGAAVSYQAPVGATVEWYTPPEVFERLGLTFDLDPCAPAIGAEWIPAAKRYAIEAGDNGLWLPWIGRVWLNPPLRQWRTGVR
jgi:hypothetical protein